MARAVTIIQPTITRFQRDPLTNAVRKRVAGYARVSTDNDEQLTSYEAQVDYYTRHIQSNSEWEFVEVYTDEGISATSTKRRDGFNRMIADALCGKIDLILTKSVSRFARNTVDTLTTVRQLKEKGVEVYFEKENIYTLDSKGELLITIMSSLAQEESRSISENVTWGQRKRFADGKVSLPYSHFLGFDKGEDGLPKINEGEAATVRKIYSMFLEGKTLHAIAKHLTAEGIPSPAGKERWQPGTVKSILTNEKYKGDALLQKKYTVDFLTKKQKVNEGEVPQYYVENSHPAIISTEVFDMVQQEMKQRKAAPNRYSGAGIFASRIVCGQCGGFYGSKIWHSSDKYRRTVYQCNNKFKGKDKCKTPHLDEETIKKMFITAVNELLMERDEFFANYEIIKDVLFNTLSLDAEYTELQNEMTVVSELIQNCIDENAHIAIRQEEYTERYERLVARFEASKIRLAEVDGQRQEKKARRDMVEAFLDILKKQDTLITEFDEQLWYGLTDKITVYSGSNMSFIFKDGTTIKVS